MAGTALVTGGTGFIGSHLVHRLVAEGFEVHALRRAETEPWRLRDILSKVHLQCGDLQDRAGIRRIVRAVRPDYVFHLAAAPFVAGRSGGLQEVVAGNLTATVHLLEACAEVDYRSLVHTGDAFEYGAGGASLSESDPCSPATPYAITKHAATLLALATARSTGQPIVSARLFSVHGPDNYPARLIPQVIAGAGAGTPVALSRPDARRDYVYVDDVVRFYLAAARTPGAIGGVFNVGTGRGTTYAELIETIFRLVGRRTEVRWGAYPASAYDEMQWVADIRRANNVLGWAPQVSLEEGLERTIASST